MLWAKSAFALIVRLCCLQHGKVLTGARSGDDELACDRIRSARSHYRHSAAGVPADFPQAGGSNMTRGDLAPLRRAHSALRRRRELRHVVRSAVRTNAAYRHLGCATGSPIATRSYGRIGARRRLSGVGGEAWRKASLRERAAADPYFPRLRSNGCLDHVRVRETCCRGELASHDRYRRFGTQRRAHHVPTSATRRAAAARSSFS